MLAADARWCADDRAAAESFDTLPAGTRLGAYEIDRLLGEGGMGFVYAATHVEIKRRVAIKMLRPELARYEQMVTRFLNEAKSVNVIKHHNIVDISHFSSEVRGSVYFVMELLEGETLDDLMHRRRALPLPLLLHVFGQIARALAAAHAKQIVHRDLKPANVFLVAREHDPCFVKLLDFGIAQLRGAGAVHGLTLDGAVMGTPQYMSPEQISGGTVTAQSDVWAIGVMLYRAATGHAPFPGDELRELADQILHRVPRPAAELAAMPAELAALIASCLARRLEDRCPSVDELLAGLARVKQAAGLDDVVGAGDGAIGEPGLAPRDRTRDSVAGSLPQYQGAPEPRASARPATPSRLRRYLGLGAIGGAAGILVVALATREGSEAATPPDRPTGPAEPPGTTPDPPGDPTGPAGTTPDSRRGPTVGSALAAGDLTAARAIADRHLRDAISGDNLGHQRAAVEALAFVRTPAGAPLLHIALAGPSDVLRVEAARALGALALPDSAPKVRAALNGSRGRIQLELAAPLAQLGDRDVHAILTPALGDQATELTAALALTRSGSDAGLAVLARELRTLPPSAARWRDVAGALLARGDATARARLQDERSQSDAERALGAAGLLAAAGDAAARAQVVRNAGDPSFARRGEAALVLARLGDRRAVEWVTAGFASRHADDRRRALAICAALRSAAATHLVAIAKLADDPDLRVRLTAEAVVLGLEEAP